jgi:glutamyl-tRNA synthetase
MIKTRFAPSPTGNLHIGGARTAIFNYLFAHHHKGEFCLRIEDTDKERSKQEFEDNIFNGLMWLGLQSKYDLAVVQSEQIERHKEICSTLLKNGGAYLCYTTQEELDEQREIATQKNIGFKYDRKWRPPINIEPNFDEPSLNSIKPSIRIKMPLDGVTEFDDLIHGKKSINNSELDDFVIMRSDGTPTYLLAVVVDDHDSLITHVIRGNDHITNTYKQIQIYKAMGWEVPTFAHLPLIHDENGKKYSKRNGAPDLLSYEKDGYLPEAVCSYLAGLGWGHAKDFMTMEEMIASFDITQIGKSPSRTDKKKLDNINYHFLQKVNIDEVKYKIYSECTFSNRGFNGIGVLFSKDETDINFYNRLNANDKMVFELKERAKNWNELIKSVEFLHTLPEYDDGAKTVLSSNIEIIKSFLSYFFIGGDFHSFPEKYELKMKDVAITLRCALSGSKISSGSIDTIIQTLGEEEVISRLRKAIDVFGK